MIRPYKESDLVAISDIENLCFDKGVAYPMYKLKNEFDAAPGRVFVTELDRRLTGYFWSELWKVNDEDPEYKIMEEGHHVEDGDVLYIANIAVSPEFRRQGLGEIMMMHMLEQLPAVRYAILAVSSKNIAAQRIYQNLGFKIVCEIAEYYLPDWKERESAYIMKLKGGKK